MAAPRTPIYARTIAGGPAMSRMHYECLPPALGKIEFCHFCSATFKPFDFICRDKNHPTQPMHLGCFMKWFAALDYNSDIGSCPMPDCIVKHDAYRMKHPECKVWTFGPIPSPDINIPTEDADEYARVALTWMLTLNSFEIDNLTNWPRWRAYAVWRKEVAKEKSMKMLQGLRAGGTSSATKWNAMSWPEQMEVLTALQIDGNPKSNLWIRAANEGYKLEDAKDAASREMMLQNGVEYLMEYISALVLSSKIRIIKANDMTGLPKS